MGLLKYDFLDIKNSRHLKVINRLLSLIGKKFNSLTIVDYDTPKRDKNNWLKHCAICVCDCGVKKSIDLTSVLSGVTKTCGCSKFSKENLIGQRFGRLIILEMVKKAGTNIRYVKCLCDCGEIKIIRYSNLKDNKTVSCGCFYNETRGLGKHYLVDHKLYKVWSSMKDRCGNPNNSGYKNYGGKGVTVCPEWLADFKVFYDWCIENRWEPGLVIDKDIKYKAKHGTDTGMIYSPEYCTVVSYKENLRSTRRSRNITINGETKTLVEWSEISGIDAKTIWARIKRGWSITQLLEPAMDNGKNNGGVPIIRRKY